MSTADQLKQYELDTFGCHVWTGKLGSNGRPIIWRGRTPTNAYKAAYEDKYGKVKDGLVLDHACRNVLCCNAEHLTPVTPSFNERMKSMAFRMKRAVCARGHQLNEATRMLTPNGGVLCRSCHRSNR